MTVLVIADYSETQDVRLRYRDKRRVVVWDPTDVQNETIGVPFNLYLVVVLPSMVRSFGSVKTRLATAEVKCPATTEEAMRLIDEFLVASATPPKKERPSTVTPPDAQPLFLDRQSHRSPAVSSVAHSPPKPLPDQAIITDRSSNSKSEQMTPFEKEYRRLKEENRILKEELERSKSKEKGSIQES